MKILTDHALKIKRKKQKKTAKLRKMKREKESKRKRICALQLSEN